MLLEELLALADAVGVRLLQLEPEVGVELLEGWARSVSKSMSSSRGRNPYTWSGGTTTGRADTAWASRS